ncbi:hypothetical protein ATO8_00010 [Roseivivax marinus]|jgi:hypothetical protein|uniref:Uncharacterized protein n=1 Tax=Roseivivax marinus TaxID=1379903 RepID=W4HQG0_9RHOB|nr:hypothetical protein [Roseivivax marinus]ETW14245.1 hypothetical protein ATO8_00010 [Roseivivax marinus]
MDEDVYQELVAEAFATREALLIAITTLASELEAVHRGSRLRVAQQLLDHAESAQTAKMKVELTSFAHSVRNGP